MLATEVIFPFKDKGPYCSEIINVKENKPSVKPKLQITRNINPIIIFFSLYLEHANKFHIPRNKTISVQHNKNKCCITTIYNYRFII